VAPNTVWIPVGEAELVATAGERSARRTIQVARGVKVAVALALAETQAQPKPVEPKPVEPKPVEPKPVEPKPVEPKPVETKPVETKPIVEPPPVAQRTEPPKPAVVQLPAPRIISVKQEDDGAARRRRLGIGLGVGLGVAVVAGVAVGLALGLPGTDHWSDARGNCGTPCVLVDAMALR
jgi:hypothetical protein